MMKKSVLSWPSHRAEAGRRQEDISCRELSLTSICRLSSDLSWISKCTSPESGEVRKSPNTKTGFRLAVHFEKKGLKSVLIKPENLCIAFELPNEE
jgi:hypothetical protein